jgi:excisionase family DNA binding protein
MIEIYSTVQVAELLSCSTNKVEEMARTGALPGIKPGVSWIFPVEALARQLESMALEEAKVRKATVRAPIAVMLKSEPARQNRSKPLPRLVDLT